MNAYKAYWNRRQINDKRLNGAAQRAFVNVMNIAIENKKSPDIDYIYKTMLHILGKQMAIVYKDGMVNGLNEAEKKYGKPLPVIKKNENSINIRKEVSVDDLLALGIPNDLAILRLHGVKQIKTMAENLHSTITKAIESNIIAGGSVYDLSRKLQDIQEQKTWRALRIAQTETTRLYNGGTLEGYKKSTVIKGKEWIINTFGNVREWHREASGQVVDINKPFIVMGEKLMYPGDANGSAKNIINCHCGLNSVIRVPGINYEEPTTPVDIVTPAYGRTAEYEKFLIDSPITDSRLLDNTEGGFNVVEKIKVRGNGSLAFKPVTGEYKDLVNDVGGTLWSRERAAYLIDKKMDYNRVPITVIKENIDGTVKGSAQVWEKGERAIDLVGIWGVDMRKAEGWMKVEKVKMDFFDAIIANYDRHGKNYLINIDTKKFVYIDNGYSLFGYGEQAYQEFKMNDPIYNLIKYSSKDVVVNATKDLNKLLNSNIFSELEIEGLNKGAIDALKERVQYMIYKLNEKMSLPSFQLKE